MIETIDGKSTVRCDGCGEVIRSTGSMAGEHEHFCDECSTPANQEFRICTHCGLPMVDGMTDLDGFYAHEECFEQAMADTFEYWRKVDDDGCDGYYEWYDAREQEWCGTGIFYTTWY